MKIKRLNATIKDQASEPARIALFGGTFDPVHHAHLKVAHCALEQANLDHLIFVPASKPPLKARPLSQDTVRLEMLQLALLDETRFEISTYEIEQNKISYTIDTVDHFRTLYSSAELFWIIGEDQFVQLDKWHRIHELVKKVVFLVYPRGNLRQRTYSPIDGLRHLVLNAEEMSISSTKVRDYCKKGLPLTGLVPHSVEVFIQQRNLYKKVN